MNFASEPQSCALSFRYALGSVSAIFSFCLLRFALVSSDALKKMKRFLVLEKKMKEKKTNQVNQRMIRLVFFVFSFQVAEGRKEIASPLQLVS